MRDERIPPLPERDNRRTIEYWQDQPYGSVRVQQRRNDPVSLDPTSEESNVAQTDEGSKESPDSTICESQGTVARSVDVHPTLGQPKPVEVDNVIQLRQEPRRPPPSNTARPRESNVASKPQEQVASKVGDRTDQSSSSDEEAPRVAPLVEEPLRNDDGRACLLTSSHYIVCGSVGPHPSAMRPFHMAFDTGSGYNVIRLRDLPTGWERYRVPNATMPALGDANGNRLRLLGKVVLRVRFGSAMYRIAFLVAERLAVSVIIGTSFMNRHVRGIMCMDGEIRLTRATIPILSRHHERKPYVEAPSSAGEPPSEVSPHRKEENFSCSHTVKLSKPVTIPPRSQVAVPVRTEASGLVFLEPKHSVLARHNVRTANGVAEVKRNRPFTIVVSNFSEQPRKLHKNMTIGYATRSPMGVYCLNDENSRAFEQVLNLPFVRKDDTPRRVESSDVESPPKSKPIDWHDSVDLSHIDDESLRAKILSMLSKHQDMWRPGHLGEITATEHRIELAPGTKPIRQAPYRQGHRGRDVQAEEISKMLEAGVIEPATSEWASPVVLVPKKDGSLRFCIDYRRLNAKTVADAYPLPRMDDCLDSLGDAGIFSTFDCNSGYWQIPVAPEDRDKTTFITHMGTFRHVRMPFGLRNAPATFQRALDIILSGVRWQTCLIYLDDVIVFSKNEEEHVAHVDEVLTLLRSAGVSLKLKKCEFFKPKVDYLGHVITPGKLAVATENTKAFEHAAFPRNATQVRSFLGAANVYRRFVKNFSGIAKPLNSMLKKDARPSWDNPEPEAVEAFETLKRKLISPPVLALPKRGRPYMIDTDASAYQLGATLLQQQDPSKPKEWVPVGYWSKTLNSAEQNYSATERECYSVVWAVTTLRPYIEGQKFTVRTDHDALRWLLTLSDPSGRLMRWRLRLSEFDFEIQYRPGRVHQVPDALSRLITPGSDSRPVDDEIPTFGDHPVLVTTRSSKRSSTAEGQPTTEDPEPQSVPQYSHHDDEVMDDVLDEALDVFDIGIAEGTYEPVDVTPANVPTKITIEEILEAQKTDAFCQTVLARQSKRYDSAFFEGPDGLLRRRHPREPDIEQVVLPDSLRPRVLQLAHHAKLAGHPGQTRMYYNVRRTYYWPHMAADIFATVRNCTTCAKNRLKLRKRTNPLKLFPATKPLASLCIDILGPLTKSKRGYVFLLVITDRFTKLTRVVPLRKITAYNVAVAFVEHWVFSYGPPECVISDNGKQFAAKFFQAVCELLGISNVFTSTYHPQTNGQVERYNRTILAMLRNYVNEHQNDWDEFATVLTYAYNNHVHRSTGTTPFDLVLSRPPPAFSLYHNSRGNRKPTGEQREHYVEQLDATLAKAYDRLIKTQRRYKRDFDKRVRTANRNIRPGEYVYLDPTDGTTKGTKLGNHALGPYRVLANDRRTFVIQRGDEVERVNSDRITYAPPPPEVPPPEPLEATPEDLAEKSTEGRTYLFDRIKDHRILDDGKTEFLIKWHGYKQPTWQPRRDISEEAISQYLSRKRRKARAPKS